jgi:autophagy-related protein 2
MYGKESPLSLGSVQTLQSKTDRFFRLVSGISVNDIVKAGKILDSGCESNHLRLLAAPIILEGEEQRNIQGNVLRISLSIARADLREVLSDVSSPLIEFVREKNAAALPKRPELKIDYKEIHHALKRSRGRRFAAPKREVNVSLTPFLSEFDISILDRISSVLYKSPFASSTSANEMTSPSSPGYPVREPKLDIKIECPNVDVRLRFPIPDLRPIHDPQRIPWWQRNVRPDYILMNFKQMRAALSLNTPQVYDICANEVNLFYCESDLKVEKVSIGKAVMCESAKNRYGAQTFDYPRVVVEIPNEKMLQKLQETARKYPMASR